MLLRMVGKTFNADIVYLKDKKGNVVRVHQVFLWLFKNLLTYLWVSQQSKLTSSLFCQSVESVVSVSMVCVKMIEIAHHCLLTLMIVILHEILTPVKTTILLCPAWVLVRSQSRVLPSPPSNPVFSCPSEGLLHPPPTTLCPCPATDSFCFCRFAYSGHSM